MPLVASSCLGLLWSTSYY